MGYGVRSTTDDGGGAAGDGISRRVHYKHYSPRGSISASGRVHHRHRSPDAVSDASDSVVMITEPDRRSRQDRSPATRPISLKGIIS